MTTWIFQGNPTIFNLDKYLESVPGAITWLVRQNANDIAIGDTVFLWRSQGKATGEKRSGVIACAEVISQVSPMQDEPESRSFWIEKSKVGTIQPRVWLTIIRVANKREELKREWLAEDEYLKNMLILRQPAGTNFKLTAKEGDRPRKMWSRAGQDWNRSESVAGLWAYVETFGKEVSKSSLSPVGKASALTGRAVTGVYNKVMHYRSLDPRAPHEGMSGAGKTDRVVWAEFFDGAAQTLNEDAVRAEFERLWGVVTADPAVVEADEKAESEVFAGQVGKLLSRPLDELLAAYNRQRTQGKGGGSTKPKTRSGRATIFERNPLVVAIARARASNQCETPGCVYPIFEDQNGYPYCEVHHIVPLAEGGADIIENVVCLCPGHHREVHFGKSAGDLRQQFLDIRPPPRGSAPS